MAVLLRPGNLPKPNSTGEITPETLREYEKCLEILLTARNRAERVQMLEQQKITGRDGLPLSEPIFNIRCQAAFLARPDDWRDRLEAKLGGAVDDDSWNDHIVTNAIRLAKGPRWARRMVHTLFLHNPDRWRKFEKRWRGKPGFEGFKLPYDN